MQHHHPDTRDIYYDQPAEEKADAGMITVQGAYQEPYHDKTTHLELRDQELATTGEGDHGTKRALSPRVCSMIAIAGTIGTGLFLSSGAAIAQGGAVGCFLGYLVMGIVIGCMMYCLVSCPPTRRALCIADIRASSYASTPPSADSPSWVPAMVSGAVVLI